MGRFFKRLRDAFKDENFVHGIEGIEILIAKVLAIAMIGITIYATGDLIAFIVNDLSTTPFGNYYQDLFKLFGLFLNILIALEILENITGYLKKHVFQVELVIATSLIAVARKIIILDLGKTEGIEIIGLGIAVLALSVSYLIVRNSSAKREH